VRVSPGLLLPRIEEGPGDDAALFLTLSHLDGLALLNLGLFQGAID
jgi:hypothetical protein